MSTLSSFLQLSVEAVATVYRYEKKCLKSPAMDKVLLDQAFQLAQEKRFAEAEAIYRQLLARFPEVGLLHSNLGGILGLQGRIAESLPYHQRAIALLPNDPQSLFNHAKALHALERQHDAIPQLRKVLAIDPNFIAAYEELGECLSQVFQEEEAVEWFKKYIVANPKDPVGHAYLGQTRRELGEVVEGQDDLRRAIEIDPKNPLFHQAFGMGELLLGHLETGWAEVEHRWDMPDFAPMKSKMVAPRWDGTASLSGKTIFLQPEQGMGDAIHFIRCSKLMADQGATIYAGCHAPLKRVLETVPGVHKVLAAGEPLVTTDYWVPTMTLPKYFGAQGGEYYAPQSYITADPARVAVWKERLGKPRGRRVGIFWSGNPKHSRDFHRSMKFADLAPLCDVPNLQIYSLQRDINIDAARATFPRLPVTDLSAHLFDFTETAAVLENLDVLITVDTSIAHLAGALGRPVWNLLAWVPDWRWQLQGDTTPWYPSMTLIRQTKKDDWTGPMAEVVRRLKS